MNQSDHSYMTANAGAQGAEPSQPMVVSGILHSTHTPLDASSGLNENGRETRVCMLGSQLKNCLEGLEGVALLEEGHRGGLSSFKS